MNWLWRLRRNPIPAAYDRGYRDALEDVAAEQSWPPAEYETRLSRMRERLGVTRAAGPRV